MYHYHKVARIRKSGCPFKILLQADHRITNESEEGAVALSLQKVEFILFLFFWVY